MTRMTDLSQRVEIDSVSPVSSYRETVYTQSVGVRFESGDELTVFDGEARLSESAVGETVDVVIGIDPASDPVPTDEEPGIYPTDEETEWVYDFVGSIELVAGDGTDVHHAIVTIDSVQFRLPEVPSQVDGTDTDMANSEIRWRFNRSRATLDSVL